MPAKNQIELLKRGAQEIFSAEELEKKLSRGKPLRIKLGFDPTIADLHLGHIVVMQKLRQFQELGHHVIFLIGDYTALVGDPSGQSKTRPTLTPKEVEANAKTYLSQAFKILDKKKTEIRKNSEWLGKLKPLDLLRLTAHYNVARMLEREDFKNRHHQGVSITIQEFIYPLLQGYDSVALKADVELGGSDQKFNLVVARDIQRAYALEPEVILTMPLLLGTDGEKKMSKSYGNYVGIQEPAETIFGKIMSISDNLMWHYYEVLTNCDLAEVKKIHPKEAKVKLGLELVGRFYSQKEALAAAAEFEKIFSKKEKPFCIEETVVSKVSHQVSLLDILVTGALATSKGEARRLIRQKGVRVDDEVVEDEQAILATNKNYLIQVGKRRFKKIIFK